MSRETVKFKSALADMEYDAKALEIRIDGLVRGLRDNLNPMMKARDLPVERIASRAFDLEARHLEYMELLSEIEKAKDILGR
jgi:hypothetical protein